MRFQGKCTDLKGHVFDCLGHKQADQYVTTKHEIEEYLGHQYKYGTDIMLTLEFLERFNVPVPEDILSDVNMAMKLIILKQIKEYVKCMSILDKNICTAYMLI